MSKLASFAIFSVLAACGGGSKPATTTPAATATSAQPAPASQLGIADLKLFQGKEMVMHLLGDGTLQILNKGTKNGAQFEEWMTVGKVAADGTLTAKDGKTAHLKPDGTLETPDGKDPGFKIEGDALVANNKRLTIDATGALMLDGQPLDKAEGVHFEGVTDAATRRTALLLVALTLGGEQHVEQGGTEVK